MKHYCDKKSFLCSQLTESTPLYLESFYVMPLCTYEEDEETISTVTFENSLLVKYCPFCGYKSQFSMGDEKKENVD